MYMVEETTEVEGSDSADKVEGSPVPYERFNEVNAGLKDAKTEIETLKSEMETLKSSQPEEEEKIPADWKEVKDMAVAQMRKEQDADNTEAEAQEQAIEVNIEHLKSLGHEISDETETAILRELIKSGTNDPNEVFKIYLKQKDAGKETERIDESKGVVSKSKGGERQSGEFTYAEMRNTSLEDMVENAREQEKSK